MQSALCEVRTEFLSGVKNKVILIEAEVQYVDIYWGYTVCQSRTADTILTVVECVICEFEVRKSVSHHTIQIN